MTILTEAQISVAPPTVLPVNPDGIPAALKALHRWVLWRYDQVRDKPDEYAKVPYKINGKKARANDERTWSTFDAALRVYQRGGWAGLGIVLGDGLVGIDLDDVRTPDTGEYAPFARGILDGATTYVEVSPSGMGCKAFAFCGLQGGADTGAEPIGNFAIEVYKGCDTSEPRPPRFSAWPKKGTPDADWEHANRSFARWFAVTGHGNGLNVTSDVALVQRAVDALVAARSAKGERTRQANVIRTATDRIATAPTGTRHNALKSGAVAITATLKAQGVAGDTIADILTAMGESQGLPTDEALEVATWSTAVIPADAPLPPLAAPQVLPAPTTNTLASPLDNAQLSHSTGPALMIKRGHVCCPDCKKRPGKSKAEYGGGYFCSCHTPAYRWTDAEYADVSSLVLADKQTETKEATLDLLDAAKYWAEHFGEEWAYDGEANCWRQWVGTHWARVGNANHHVELDTLAIDILHNVGLSVSSSGRIDGCIRTAATQCSRVFAESKLINFTNGTLDPSSGTLHTHARVDTLTTCLPYDYVPGCYPTIERFLDQTIPEQAMRRAYMVHIGLALLGDRKLHKALLLLGPPRSGKSTLLGLANVACGNVSTANAGPELFDRETEGLRSRATWNGRRLVTLEELPTEALRNESLVKAMVAHGGVAQRRLNQHEATDNQWTAKLIMATNEAPRFADRSGALTERLLPILCPNHRPEKQRNLNLLEQLLVELPGFIPACIKAAQQTLALGYYPTSAAMRSLLERIETSGDALKSFVAEHLILDAKAWTPTDSLYEAYKSFCTENGNSPMAKERFTIALCERYQGVSQNRSYDTGTRKRGLAGIRFRETWEVPDDDTTQNGTRGTREGVSCPVSCPVDLAQQNAQNVGHGTRGTREKESFTCARTNTYVGESRSKIEHGKNASHVSHVSHASPPQAGAAGETVAEETAPLGLVIERTPILPPDQSPPVAPIDPSEVEDFIAGKTHADLIEIAQTEGMSMSSMAAQVRDGTRSDARFIIGRRILEERRRNQKDVPEKGRHQ